MNRPVLIVSGLFVFVVILVSIGLYVDYVSSNKANDALLKKCHEAYVKDSIEHSAEYIDSVRRAEERYRKWKEEWERCERIHKANDIVGVYYSGEDEYHNHFHDYFQKADIGSLEFVTENMVESKGLSLCRDCDMYKNIEDIEITDLYTKEEIIEKYNISKDDVE